MRGKPRRDEDKSRKAEQRDAQGAPRFVIVYHEYVENDAEFAAAAAAFAAAFVAAFAAEAGLGCWEEAEWWKAASSAVPGGGEPC